MAKEKIKWPKEEIDPFFGLKYIAYIRTGLLVNEEDQDEETLVSFAKWQICKVRNILWNDPIWNHYTNPEILIEFFAIKFDESAELRQKFESGIITAKVSDLEWMERAERKLKASKIKQDEELKPKEKLADFVPEEPVEFEDKF